MRFFVHIRRREYFMNQLLKNCLLLLTKDMSSPHHQKTFTKTWLPGQWRVTNPSTPPAPKRTVSSCNKCRHQLVETAMSENLVICQWTVHNLRTMLEDVIHTCLWRWGEMRSVGGPHVRDFNLIDWLHELFCHNQVSVWSLLFSMKLCFRWFVCRKFFFAYVAQNKIEQNWNQKGFLFGMFLERPKKEECVLNVGSLVRNVQ